MSMEGGDGVRLVAAAMVVVTMTMTMTRTGSAELIKVGNSNNGWALGPLNLTEWATHQPFYVGVWIGFWFEANRQQYSVLRVNKTSYDNCDDRDYIVKVSKGVGRDVFLLNETGMYYFLSAGGYCWGGLKIAVNVELPPRPPAVAPTPNDSPASYDEVMHILLCVIATFYMFCL